MKGEVRVRIPSESPPSSGLFVLRQVVQTPRRRSRSIEPIPSCRLLLERFFTSSLPQGDRRRIKEQQKRCFKSEFRNTHFSFTLGAEGVEQFVSTPELHSDEAIEGDPLPPGQVWADWGHDVVIALSAIHRAKARIAEERRKDRLRRY